MNSKEFRREVKDDRSYSQELLYSQGNNLVRPTKADDRRITRMKNLNYTNHTCDPNMAAPTLSRGYSATREVTKQLVNSADLLLHYCSNSVNPAKFYIIPKIYKSAIAGRPIAASHSYVTN